MLSFSPSKQGVIAFDGPRSFRLEDFQVEALLDAFEIGGLITSHASLYAAHLAVGGIERTTSLRSAA